MEIIHKSNIRKFNLNIDYNVLLGDKWTEILKKELHTEYQSNLMFYLNHIYSELNLNSEFNYFIKNIKKKDIFKCLKLCEPDKLKAVIINCHPTFSKRYNGLAFGNIQRFYNEDYDDHLIDLFNIIEQIQDDNFKVDKDYTLESWAKQGVLLLNYPLLPLGKNEDHKFYRFTLAIVEYISTLSGLPIVFINNRNGWFKNKLENTNNYIIEKPNLDYALLESINDLIESTNGRDSRIKW